MSTANTNKGQFTITNTNSTVSGNQATFTLPSSINYNKICLEAASFINPQPYSMFNISAVLGNNQFSYGSIYDATYHNAISRVITIPDGNYTPASLCAYISARIQSGGPGSGGAQLMTLTYNAGTNTITVSIGTAGYLACQILRPANNPTIYDKLYTALGLLPSLLRPNTTYDLFTSTYEGPYGGYAGYPSGQLTGGQVDLTVKPMTNLTITSPQFQQQYSIGSANPSYSIGIDLKDISVYYQRASYEDNDIQLANNQRQAIQTIQLNFWNGSAAITLSTFAFKFTVFA